MNRQDFLKHYEKLSPREQNLLKEKLAQPWIAQKAIDCVPADINTILDLIDKAKSFQEKAINNIKLKLDMRVSPIPANKSNKKRKK